MYSPPPKKNRCDEEIKNEYVYDTLQYSRSHMHWLKDKFWHKKTSHALRETNKKENNARGDCIFFFFGLSESRLNHRARILFFFCSVMAKISEISSNQFHIQRNHYWSIIHRTGRLFSQTKVLVNIFSLAEFAKNHFYCGSITLKSIYDLENDPLKLESLLLFHFLWL